jgi:hypothetical protein
MAAARPRDYGRLGWRDLFTYYLARWRGRRALRKRS